MIYEDRENSRFKPAFVAGIFFLLCIFIFLNWQDKRFLLAAILLGGLFAVYFKVDVIDKPYNIIRIEIGSCKKYGNSRSIYMRKTDIKEIII